MQSEPGLATSADATPTTIAIEAVQEHVEAPQVVSLAKDDAVLLRGWRVVAALSLGYVGIYLCRKNLSVAVPLLQVGSRTRARKMRMTRDAGEILITEKRLCTRRHIAEQRLSSGGNVCAF